MRVHCADSISSGISYRTAIRWTRRRSCCRLLTTSASCRYNIAGALCCCRALHLSIDHDSTVTRCNSNRPCLWGYTELSFAACTSICARGCHFHNNNCARGATQDVLQQLLRLGALSDVPDDLQWTARMLLPKSVACAPADETRSPPQRPAPPATLAGWVPPSEPPPPAGPAQHDVATLAAAPDLTACAGTPAPVALTAPAVAAQPRPPSAGPAAIGPPQQPAVVMLPPPCRLCARYVVFVRCKI